LCPDDRFHTSLKSRGRDVSYFKPPMVCVGSVESVDSVESVWSVGSVKSVSFVKTFPIALTDKTD
jgi:hypothetical protein